MDDLVKQPRLMVRRMREVDLNGVLNNEQAAYTHPWSQGIFHDCLHTSGYHCLVALLNGQIIGHAILTIAVGEAHLLNICVAPNWQSRGLGRILLKRIFRLSREKSADTLFLEVRAGNHVAALLYESEGFSEIGQRRGYYPAEDGQREDAVIYAKPLA
jgi:ribosomal-protein-alanine N-acetyltransferase